jgi:hypothetical protein
MNERGAEVLEAAAMKGTKQIKGRRSDGLDGYCALGILDAARTRNVRQEFGLTTPVSGCPECGAMVHPGPYNPGMPIADEDSLIAHLNNDHDWDFLTIARKLGPSENS